MDFRKTVFTLGFITTILLAVTLGYTNNALLKQVAEKNTEIAELNLKQATMEAIIVGPRKVEGMVNDKGVVLIRVDGNNNYIYEFPRLCRTPGLNGNL